MLDNVIKDAFDAMAFFAVGFVIIRNGFGDAKRVGVEGRLWNEAIWEGDAEEAGDTGCQPEEENVPVKTGGFA